MSVERSINIKKIEGKKSIYLYLYSALICIWVVLYSPVSSVDSFFLGGNIEKWKNRKVLRRVQSVGNDAMILLMCSNKNSSFFLFWFLLIYCHTLKMYSNFFISVETIAMSLIDLRLDNLFKKIRLEIIGRSIYSQGGHMLSLKFENLIYYPHVFNFDPWNFIFALIKLNFQSHFSNVDPLKF